MISSLCLSMICAQTRFAFVAWKTGFHFSGSCSNRIPDAVHRCFDGAPQSRKFGMLSARMACFLSNETGRRDRSGFAHLFGAHDAHG